jgi:hypothetical protein
LVFSGFSGTFEFNSDTLRVSKSVNFTALIGGVNFNPPAALEFIGAGTQNFTPKPSLQLPCIIQNGTSLTTIVGQNLTCKGLIIKNGTFNCGGFKDTIGFIQGPSGTINLNSSGLIITGPIADFSQLIVVTNPASSVEFRGSYITQNFIPKPGYPFPWVGSTANGDTIVISTNSLSAIKVNVGSASGGWRWGNGLKHIIDTLTSTGTNNIMDFANDTVKIMSGDFSFSGIVKVKSTPSAKIEFSGASGLQTLVCPSSTFDTLPGIVHSGADTLNQIGPLKCYSFLQTAGTFKINGQHDTVTTGNFIVANTAFSASSFCYLDNSYLLAQNGDVVLNGHSNDSINLNPANPWTITALNGHTISADYALIHFSTATAASANATNSHDIPTNIGWTFVNPNTKIWNNGTGNGLWNNAGNWAPPGAPGTADTVIFNNTSLSPCSLDAAPSIASIRFNSLYTGSLKFLSYTLQIANVADLSMMPGNNISPGTGALEFVGSSAHSLLPPPSSACILPKLIQSGGTLSIEPGSSSLKTSNLTVNAGAVTVNNSWGIKIDTISVSSGASFDFGTTSVFDTIVTLFGTGAVNLNNAAIMVKGDFNVSGFSTVLPGNNSVNFIGSATQTFTPKPNVMFGQIGQMGTGTTTVFANGFGALALGLYGGIFNLGSGLTDSITVGFMASGGALDMGTASTLKLAGSTIDFNALTNLAPGTGSTVDFCASSGNQTFTPKKHIGHPNIVHSGGGTLFQTDTLKCQSFTQTAGTYDINGMDDTITPGNFSVSNGKQTSLAGLANSNIIVWYGAVNFSGAGPADTLNMMASNQYWVKAVTGSLSASYAKIKNCFSGGGATGMATNCVDSLNNTNWTFVAANTKFWTNGTSDNLWSTPGNWSPSGIPTSIDSVVFNGTGNFNCVINSSPTIKAITLTAYSANLNFTTNDTMKVLNMLDFQYFYGSLTGNGVIALNGTTTQIFYPPYTSASNKLPKIILNNPNGANVPYNRLCASNLTITNGYMTLNSGFNIDSIYVNSPGTLDLSYSYNYDTVVTISGTGNLNMGFADFSISGDMNLANLNLFYPENAQIKFIGPNNKSIYSNNSGVPTSIEQINGTTTVLNKRIIVQNLTLTGGTFNLGAGLQDTIITQLYGGAGALDFGSSTLNLEAYMTDFTSVNFTIGTGTLAFCGPNPQQFTPRAGVLHPDIIQNGYNGTIIFNNPLMAKSLTINQGSFSFDHAGSLRDSVGSLIVTTGGTNPSIALGQDTLDISGAVNLSGLKDFLWLNPGVMRFIGSAPQPFMTPFSYNPSGFWCPPIIHTGSGTITQAGMLKCASFLQTAGTYNINSAIDTIMNPTNGDFTITNGMAGSITGLGNCVIAVKYGNASFSGLSAANMLNMSPPSPWTLSVPTMSKTISAQYAIVGNCKAITYAGLMALPSYCAMAPGDSNWNMAMVMPQIYDTLNHVNSLVANQRTDVSDTIDIWYGLFDPDNAIDTVKMSFRNGVSGAWSAPINGTIVGDVGPVASNTMMVRRHARWSAIGQFGNSFASDSIQVGLSAKDNFGNMTPIIMTAAATRINTDVVPPVSVITFPSNKSYVNGLTMISGSASDNGRGVKNVEVAIKNIATGNFWNGVSAWTGVMTWLPAASNPPNAWTYNGGGPTGLTNGSTIAITSRASDSANNLQTVYGADTVIVDTIAPVSIINYPVSNSSVSSLASIAGTVSDVGAGVSGLVISLENLTDTTYWNGTGWMKGQTWLTPAGLPVGFATWSYIPPTLTNGKKYTVQSKAMDKANNFETLGTGVTFTFSTSAPGSPTIAINNRQKYTNNPLVSLALSVQNADSMQFKINAGAWSAWEQYANVKTNMSIATGGQGVKYIYVEYKDRAGNTTAPVSDSAVYDTIPPACAIATQGTFGPATWLGAVSGISSDGLSGVKSVSLRIRNEATGGYWNSNIWAPDSAWIPASGKSAWNCPLATANLPAARYTVEAFAQDSAGNKSGLSIVSVNMLSGPLAPLITIVNNQRFTNIPMVLLTLSVQNADSMHFRVNNDAWGPWEPVAPSKMNFPIGTGGEGMKRVYVEYKDKAAELSAPVYDSIVYDTTAPRCVIASHGFFNPLTWPGYFTGNAFDSMSGIKNVVVSLKNEFQGTLWNGSHWLVGDPTWLPATGAQPWKFMFAPADMQTALYSITASAFDSAGNKSMVIVDTIKYAIVPVNTINVNIQNVGDSAISTTWKVDKTLPYIKTVLYGIKYGAIPDSASTTVFRYTDTSFVMGNVTKAGTWYVATALEDSAGNKSPQRLDSVVIANTPPVLAVIKDTTVFEDRPWQGKLVATDRNGDTLHYHMANPPAGFTVDSVSGAMTWTPEYAAKGQNTIVGLVSDAHGGIAADTFSMTVMVLPPQMVCLGDSVAREDSLFTMHFQISNVGKGDTASFIKTIIPPWAKMVGDTLSGTPKAGNVGKDTIMLVLSEKAGLTDTLQKIIPVLHTDHAPKLKAWSRPDSMYQYSAASWSFIAADVDKGDSLSITWTVKPKWITVLSSAAKDTNWTFTLGGTPASTDVKWEPVVFSVRDTAGVSFTISDSLFIVPLPTTLILKDKRQISYGAAKYVVSGSDYFDTALTFLTTLRSLDDTSAALVNKTTTGAVSFYPLIDGRYEFKAQAIDRQGLKDPNAPKDTFVVSGASHHVFADVDSSWNMVSVPAVSLPVSVVAGKGSVLHWDESGAEQDIYSYYKKPPDIIQTIPGMSYWRKSPDTLAVDFKRQDVRDTTLAIQLIKGKYGWNQISSPYIYPVKWSGSTVAWRWNNQTKDYEQADSVLEPWKGYWVAADSQAVVRIDNTPVFNTTALAKKQSVYFVSKSEWQIKIKLTTGKGMDAENTLGFSRLARDGFDRLDLPKAPRFQGGRSVFFPHPDWNRQIKEFASDIRNKIQHINVFQIGIAPSLGDSGSSQLSFDGTENFSSLYCFLVDPNSVSAISTGKQYPLGPSGSVLYKQIFVTDDRNFIRNFPQTFSLANPYPNPCRPSAHINYTLPYDFANDGQLSLEPYQVKIALYDVMGRQVRELVYHKQLPGMYHILWDGKNNSGKIVASGTYFCRLTAGKFAATTRLVMMK